MDMLSDYDNLDVMLGNENNNPIERELAEAIDQSSAHGDDDTNVYHENEFRDYLHENEPLRQNEVRQSFEAFSSEFNLRLSQEMESMVSIMHSQINRAITTAIAERVIPEIQNIANSMSSMGHRDTEASSSPNSQENRESAPGPKIKIAKKDSRSVGDLRDTMSHGSYNGVDWKQALPIIQRIVHRAIENCSIISDVGRFKFMSFPFNLQWYVENSSKKLVEIQGRKTGSKSARFFI